MVSCLQCWQKFLVKFKNACQGHGWQFTNSWCLHTHSLVSVRLPNMTGCSHSYHSIKLVHCSAPQRDVLSDKMAFWVVTQSFYFMLCQSSLLSTVISFVYKDKLWFDEIVSYLLYGKYLKNNCFIPSPHWCLIELNFKTLLCNWRGNP